MPSGVFKPYAGVSTAILLFTKTNSGGTDDVWFYDMQTDGYSLDDKRTPQPDNSDLADILARWRNREAERKRVRMDQSFLVPKAEIADNDYNLSINRYKDVKYEATEFDPPKVIFCAAGDAGGRNREGTCDAGGAVEMITKETIQRGFPIKQLGEVAEFLDSRRRPITASHRIPGPYPYYGANGQQDSVADYIFDEPLVLLAEDGGRFDQPDRGIAYAIEGKTWVNNHAHVLRPRNGVQLRYLVRVLESYDVTPWITGSTRAKLTKAGAFKIQIPLPPLAEQKQIAEILDAADDLRAKRREAFVQLDALLQSTFLDMFGNPVTNPMGWEMRSLGDLAVEKPNNGIFRRNPEYSESLDSGLPVVWVAELFRGIRIDVSESRRLEANQTEIEKYGLLPGDLLFCRSSLKLDGYCIQQRLFGRAGRSTL